MNYTVPPFYWDYAIAEITAKWTDPNIFFALIHNCEFYYKCSAKMVKTLGLKDYHSPAGDSISYFCYIAASVLLDVR